MPYLKLVVSITALFLVGMVTLIACGPASQAEPQGQPVPQPAQEKSIPDPTNTPEPTPVPPDTVIIRPDGGRSETIGHNGASYPDPTPKYPVIYDTGLQEDVVEMEATKEAQEQDSGARRQRQLPEDRVVNVAVYLTANTLTVAEWLRTQGITTVHVREYEDGSGGRFGASAVPVSLLGALAQKDGVRKIEPLREVTVDKE